MRENTNIKKLLSCIFACFLVLTGLLPAAAETADNLLSGPSLQARSAVLLDFETGDLLFDKNGDVPIPPASLTKIMTMHLILKEVEAGRFDLDHPFEVPAEAYWRSLPADSSLMFLEPGQIVTVRELLLGLCVSSGNDAAIAAAHLVSGSVDAFVNAMNREAADLGFPLIRFADASGLDPRSCITAEEFARFCRLYIISHPGALDEFHSTGTFTYPREHNVPGSGSVRSHTTRNRNRLLETYPGLDGLKTGFIEESGYNVALTGERNGIRMIAVLLGGSGSSHREGRELLAADGRKILDYGFNEFIHLRPRDMEYGSVEVYKGKDNTVDLEPEHPVVLAIRKDRINTIQYTFSREEYLVAPLPGGSEAGMMTITADGMDTVRVPLVTVSGVEEAGMLKRIVHSLILKTKS